MALREIRVIGDPLLQKVSKPVKAIDGRIKQLLDDMHDTMVAAQGLGIAAPQVGVLKRIVLIEYEDERYELINPVILERRGLQAKPEGCLSVPGKNGIVERPEYVKVSAMDRDGNTYTVEGEEIMAVALCHELDHLDGILYPTKALEMYDVHVRTEDAQDEQEQCDESEAL
ncbi:MAG: peptide deformylase [Clostridiales bacterium]|jgi:peptide deformylase|nr:peptide deformylase [Clostridiales bacterium]